METKQGTYTIPSNYLLSKQRSLIDQSFLIERAPTFFDSKRSPIHRWFGIVPGFSCASVLEAFLQNNVITESKTVLDPFAGCGTTIVAAKAIGLKSIGIEAHPLFAFIARTKTFWDFQDRNLIEETNAFVSRVSQMQPQQYSLWNQPQFVTKLYDEETLGELIMLRDLINPEVRDSNLNALYVLALLKALKETTYAKVDGIYIAPESKKKTRKHVLESFKHTLDIIVADLLLVQRLSYAESFIIEGDCRSVPEIEDGSIGFAFTSPPYLNNFDYAEMTRLELYFLQMANDWGDITRKVRNKLITNTTTQVTPSMRQDLKVRDEIPVGPRRFIEWAQARLSEIRTAKGGKKDYDIIVVKYFNEMFEHFCEMHRVLAPNSVYILTLGDSALYGVHIPTDEILRDIALGVGFRGGDIEFLRPRGNRSQIDFNKRPRIPLREVRLRLLR